MAQHFLLSRAAKSLTLAQVMRLSDVEAEALFCKVRWPETDGAPYRPKCGSPKVYDCRRPHGAPRWRCGGCRADFSVTSGTLFASHKLPLRGYLAAIAIFCNEVKGKSMLALSRDLGISYKASFVLAHKMREVMAGELKGRVVGGDGKTREIDGGFFGGYVKPANERENRRDRRLWQNKSGKRQCVVVIRERGGNSLPAVFRTEGQALDFIRSRIAKGTTVNADEARAWDELHDRFEMKRINHEEAYSLDGACTNWAEEFFSRMRRGEIGHHHHIAGPYLLRYAQEASWREDNRRTPNGDQVNQIAALAMKRKPSVDFCGYWQRHLEKKATYKRNHGYV
ncbi:MAG TPA: IS1595 family transposase [Alphaproteobacteria bacterium]|nr:IS1595 family transposase [Alphaproteobacteria bacterium]